MEEIFNIKIVYTRVYFFICIALVILGFFLLEISAKYLHGSFIIPILFFVGVYFFVFLNKAILKLWFTRYLKIIIIEGNVFLFETKGKSFQFSIDKLKKYKIDYRKSRFYVFDIVTVDNAKIHYKFYANDESLNFLDKFHYKVKKFNTQMKKGEIIELIEPFEVTKLNKLIINISGGFIITSICVHIYFNAATSVVSLLAGISYYLTSISLRRSKIEFFNHLKSEELIRNFITK